MVFEPAMTASERAKTVYTLDRSATVTGISQLMLQLDMGKGGKEN
jgi:hypothetical protein